MTPIDITKKLELAQEAGNWNKGVFHDVLDKLAGAPAGGSIDWDYEAGEEWGRILVGGEVGALLWLRGAFAFLGLSHADVLSRVLQEYPVQFEVVDDWDEARYRIDRLSLLRLSGRGQVSEAFDTAGFSANDLWWATV
ncbi:MAG: hypothetical protein GY835_18130 [bacterium]|nr:hypothetical protein [bacterium]